MQPFRRTLRSPLQDHDPQPGAGGFAPHVAQKEGAPAKGLQQHPSALNNDALAPLLSILPGLRLMVGLVIAMVVIFGLYVGRNVLLPLALAALLGFLLDPAVSRLKRWGLPRLLSVVLVVMVAVGGVGAGALYVGSQATVLSAELPTYQNTIRQKLRNLKDYFKGPSVFDGAFKVFNTVETEIALPESGKPKPARAQKVEIQEPAAKPLQKAMDVVAKVGEPIATAGIVFLFVILILLDRSDLQDRLLRLMGRNMHMATDALGEAATRIGQYLRMQLFVNLSYGIPMWLGLWVIGVPGAALWGALAAVMRFVPYIGPMISAVFPLTLAFAVDPGWDLFLWTLALILVLELISNNIIEPWLYGSSTGLSTLSIILAATFWTALWGPVGLILSTPLTVCLLVLGRYIPALGFFEILLGSESVFDPPQKLFQRLLGGNVDEAVDVATRRIDEELPAKPTQQDTARALTRFYDGVAIPALKLAAHNYVNQSTAEHRLRLSVGTAELVEELRDHYPPAKPMQTGAPGAEEGKAGQQADAAPLILCVGLRWDIDVQAAAMAAHALQLYGLPAAHDAEALPVFPRDTDLNAWAGLRAVCICSFHPHPQTKLRQLCKRIRQRWPELGIVVALWNTETQVLDPEAIRSIQADYGVRTIDELALRIQVESGNEQLVQQAVKPEIPADEAKRLKALSKSGVLHAAHLEHYREAAIQACNAFQVPWAYVAWVDKDWVYMPGAVFDSADNQLAQSGMARADALASFVIADGAPLVIEDTQRNPRFARNPHVDSLGVRFYAAAPLRYRRGAVLGALCILDRVPREMSADDLKVLESMAEDLMKSLEDSHGTPASLPVSDPARGKAS